MKQTEVAICPDCGAEMPVTVYTENNKRVAYGICCACGSASQHPLRARQAGVKKNENNPHIPKTNESHAR